MGIICLVMKQAIDDDSLEMPHHHIFNKQEDATLLCTASSAFCYNIR